MPVYQGPFAVELRGLLGAHFGGHFKITASWDVTT